MFDIFDDLIDRFFSETEEFISKIKEDENALDNKSNGESRKGDS